MLPPHYAAAEIAAVWHEMVMEVNPGPPVRTPWHEANTIFSRTAAGQHTTLQINAIHYLSNQVPNSHHLPLPIDQNFKALVAN